jgi:hypothetical protein
MGASKSWGGAVFFLALVFFPVLPLYGGEADAVLTLIKEGKYAAATEALPGDTAPQTAALAAAVKLFAATAKETKPTPEALAKDLFLITMKNDGTQFRGKLDRTKSTATTEAYIKDSGSVFKLRPDEIAKKTPFKQEERDAEMLAEISVRQAAAQNDVDWYFCGVKALEFGFPPIAAECFYQAVKADIAVAQNVVDFLGAKLFASAIFDRNNKKSKSAEQKFAELKKKYPTSRSAQSMASTLAEADTLAQQLAVQKAARAENAKKLAQMKQEEIAALREQERQARAERKQKRSALDNLADSIADDIADAADEIAGQNPEVARADELADSAAKKMSEAQKGNRNASNANYKAAYDELKKAAAIYQKALEKNPADKASDAKLAAAMEKIYWCRKLQTL